MTDRQRQEAAGVTVGLREIYDTAQRIDRRTLRIEETQRTQARQIADLTRAQRAQGDRLRWLELGRLPLPTLAGGGAGAAVVWLLRALGHG